MVDVRKQYEAIAAIYGELQKKRKTVSNVDLMVEINNIISEYVHMSRLRRASRRPDGSISAKSTLICCGNCQGKEKNLS